MKNIHNNLISLMKELGHIDIDDGICFGYSSMLIKAICKGNKSVCKFDLRMVEIDDILNKNNTHHTPNISAILNEIKHLKPAFYNDIVRFFTGVALFQNSFTQCNNLSSNINQFNLLKSHSFFSSTSKGNLSAVKLIHTHYHAHHLYSLSDYLELLRKNILSIYNNIAIEISGTDHTTVISYDNTQNCWRFDNISDELSITKNISIDGFLSSAILHSLDELPYVNTKAIGVFTTKFYVGVNNIKFEDIVKVTTSLHAPMKFSLAATGFYNHNNVGLLWLACQNGDLPVVKELIKNGAVNTQCLDENSSTLDIAIRHEHRFVIDYLLTERQKINLPSNIIISDLILNEKAELLQEFCLSELISPSEIEEALMKLDDCYVDDKKSINFIVYYYSIQQLCLQILSTFRTLPNANFLWNSLTDSAYLGKKQFSDFRALGKKVCCLVINHYSQNHSHSISKLNKSNKDFYVPDERVDIIALDNSLLSTCDHVLRFLSEETDLIPIFQS